MGSDSVHRKNGEGTEHTTGKADDDFVALVTPHSVSSRFTIASIIMSGITMLWMLLSYINFEPLPFDPYKRDTIAGVASILAIVLGVAGRRNQSGGYVEAIIAVALATTSLLASLWFVPV